MIALLWIVNFVISVFNAWGVGRSWVETKVAGGMPRFMSWMGATMSAVGFTWCYLVVLAFAAGPDGFHKLPVEYVNKMFALGYLMIIFPCIGSGLAITCESWAYFWRRRTIGSGALAAFNTFADLYNIYEASRFVPEAWDLVKDLFSPKKKDKTDSSLAGIAILLALAALLGGILTTAAIVRTVSERTASDRRFAAGVG